MAENYLATLPTMQPVVASQGGSFAPISSVSAGINDYLAGFGRTGEALGTVLGSDSLAKSGAAYAEKQERTAAKAAGDASTDFWTPSGFVNTLARGLPTMGAMLGGGALGSIGGGALAGFLGAGPVGAALGAAAGGFLGGAAAGYPVGVGGNVQTAEKSGQPLSASDAGWALGLGVPEAVLMQLTPAMIRGGAKNPIVGSLARRAFLGASELAPVNAVQSAINTGITNSFDPDMSMGDRAQSVINSFLEGGAQGAVFGGVTHGLVGKKATPVSERLNTLDRGEQPGGVITPRSGIDATGAPVENAGALAFGKRDPDALAAALAAALEAQQPGGADELPFQQSFRPGGPATPAFPEAPDFRSKFLDAPLEPEPTQPETAFRNQGELPLPPEQPPPTAEGPLFAERQKQPLRPDLPTTTDANGQIAADIAALIAQRDGIVEKGRKATASEAQTLDTINDQLVERSKPGEQNAFFTPEEMGERKPLIDAMREKVSAEVGQSDSAQDFVRKINATNDAELYRNVVDHIDALDAADKAIPKAVKKVAQRLGIMDDTGGPRDLDAERAKLDTKVQAAWDRAGDGKNPGLVKRAQKLQADRAEIDKLIALRDQSQPVAEKPAEPVTAEAAPEATATATENVTDNVPDLFGDRDYSSPEGQALVAEAQKPDLRAQDIARLKRKIAQLPPRKAVETPVPEQQKGFVDETPAIEGGALEDGSRPWWDEQNTHMGGAMLRDLTETPEAIAERTPGAAAEAEGGPLRKNTTYAPMSQEARDQIYAERKAKTDARLDAYANDEMLPRDLRDQAVEGQKMEGHSEREARANRIELARQMRADEQPLPVAEKPAIEMTATEKPVVEKPIAEGPPAWAQEHTENRRGQIVWNNDDHAIMQAPDKTGKMQYYAVDRASGRMATMPIEKTKAGWMTPELRKDLLARAADAQAKSEAAQKRSPKGPWTGRKPNVTATESVDPRITNLLSSWMKQVGLGNVRVLITHPDDLAASDAAQKYRLNGDYANARSIGMQGQYGEMGQFGPGNRDFVMHIDPNATDGVKVETVAHEMGHIIQRVAYANAPAELKKALVDAHAKWYAQTNGMTAQEFVRSVRNREMADLDSANFKVDAPVSDVGNLAYMRSFNEWFADNVSRHMTSDEKPRTAIEKFFAGVGEKIKKLIALVTGKPNEDFVPDATVKKFMDYVASTDHSPWGDTTGKIPETNLREQARAATPQEQNDSTQRFAGAATGIAKAFYRKFISDTDYGPKSIRDAARQTANGFFPRADLVRLAAKYMPTLIDYDTAHNTKDAIGARYAQLSNGTARIGQALAAPERATLIKLLKATEFGVDPRKTWDDQPWLHDRPELAPYVAEMNKLHNGFRQRAVYERFVNNAAFEQNMRLATALDGFARSDLAEGIKTLDKSPSETFLENGLLHDDAAAARAASQEWIDHYMKQYRDVLKTQDGAIGALMKDDPKRLSMAKDVQALRSLVKDVDAKTASLERAPNFHLGRTGDFFVSAEMKGSGERVIDPASARELQKRLTDLGYGDLSINNLGSNRVFMRLDNPDQQAKVHAILEQLKQEGHVSGNVELGLAGNANPLGGNAPLWMQALIERVKGDTTLDPEARATQVAQLSRQWLDMLSDNTVHKILAHREGVQGYDNDMIANFAHRAEVSGNAMSNLAMSGRIAKAMEDANAAVVEMRREGGADKQTDILKAERYLQELTQRERERTWRVSVPVIDKLRSLTHTWFLGFSPAYMLLQQSQILMNLLPELGKKHGFMNSMQTIARTGPEAFRVMAATLRNPETRVNGIISEKVLRDAGINQKTIDILMQAANRGKLDLGGYAREMTRTAQAPTMNTALLARGGDKLQRAALATAYYAETVTRIQAALAAHELAEKNPSKVKDFASIHDYVGDVISQSMYNWTAGNTPRQMGQHGLFGPASKMVFAFTQYQTQMLSKMYRELGKSFKGDKEAMKYLAGHLAATTVLAGALGLPGLTSMAAVADRVGNALTDRDDWDLISQFREHLGHVFGKGASEAISRGLPRSFGLDLAHMGEERLLPFAKFLTDKRKFEDKMGDWAKEALGAPASMVMGVIEGARDFAQGNYLQGVTKFAPTGLRNPLQALQMGLYGYTNAKGEQLPLNAGAKAIAMKAMGFTDGQKADYDDLAADVRNLKATRSEREGRIKQNIAFWSEQNDPERVAQWMQRAAVFDQQHAPLGHMMMPTLPGFMAQRRQDMAVARGLGVPLGVKPLDLGMVPKYSTLTGQ